MEVILLEPIHKLGSPGDAVRVKAGYARNFLFPQGKAVPATAAAKAEFEARRTELERAAATTLDAAGGRAEQIDGLTVQIVRKAGEEGKLFGSVNAADIVAAAAEADIVLERPEIHLPDGPLKMIGEHRIVVTLHPEVDCNITVCVVAEAE